MFSHNRLGIGIVSSLMAALVWVSTPSARADAIEAALREEAPKIMKYVRDHGYHTIGVLKFSTNKGNQPASLNAGTLGTRIAKILENGLILLDDPSKPIDIIHDASKSAVGYSRGATYRNPTGRRGLLDHAYTVAWEPHPKQPDAFLTGEVLVAKDMRKMSIVVQAFDRKRPDVLVDVVRIKDLPVDRNVLAGIGQSFVLPRGLLHRGSRDIDKAAADDASHRDETSVNPAQDSNGPIKLQIFYDDQPVNLEADPSSPGEMRVQRQKAVDPKEGQKVKFVINNTTQETVGVVLAIDGKSTLFAEDLTSKQPGECTKWILGPGQTYTIEGFYMTEDGKEVHPFKVLSDDDSAKVELAPDQKGLFSMFVFRQGGSDSMNITAEGGELSRSPKHQAGTRTLAEVQASTRAATQYHVVNGRLMEEHVTRRPVPLRPTTQKGGRGLIVQDTQVTAGSKLNRVDAKLDSQPAISLFIRYYTGPATNPS